jgi:hypothetical protein
MMNRRRIALAAASMFCLLPVAAHAGSGGTPTAPGAGKSTDYCCQILERVTQPTGTDGTQTTQGTAKPLTFVNGTGCSAIAEDDFSRNQCSGTVVKCRGEFFTPSTGRVERCLTP